MKPQVFSLDELTTIARSALVGMPVRVNSTHQRGPGCSPIGCYEVHLLYMRSFDDFTHGTPIDFDEPLKCAMFSVFGEYELHRQRYERVWFEFPRVHRESLIVRVPQAVDLYVQG